VSCDKKKSPIIPGEKKDVKKILLPGRKRREAPFVRFTSSVEICKVKDSVSFVFVEEMGNESAKIVVAASVSEPVAGRAPTYGGCTSGAGGE